MITCATPPPSEKPSRSTCVVAEGADEGDGVGGHLVDGVRHRSARCADAAVVERDHVSLGGDAVDDPRVPVIQDGGEVVQEDERHAGARAELAVGERRAADVDVRGRRGPPGRGRGRGLAALTGVVGVIVQASRDASEAAGFERLLVGGSVVQRQVARLLGAPHVGEHRRLRAGAGERREELGVLDVESFLEAERAADVGGALDRGDGELQSLGEPVAERDARSISSSAGTTSST